MAVANPVVPDATGEGGAKTGTSGTLTWSHTPNSGDNRIVIVTVNVGDTDDSTLTIDSGYPTYAGSAMTEIGSIVHANAGTAGYARCFYLLAPATGASTININWTDSADITTETISAGSLSFTGVNQTTPITDITNATGSSPNGSVSVPNTATDGYCCSMLVTGGTITGVGETLAWTLGNGSGVSAGDHGQLSYTVGDGGTIVMNHIHGNDWWAVKGWNLAAAAAGVGTNTIIIVPTGPALS